MADNLLFGTHVADIIVPGTSADTYPTHDAKYGKGGFRAVENLQKLDEIASPRLDPGMFVYVIDPGVLYVYEVTNNVGTWRVWESGGGGGSNINSYTSNFTAVLDQNENNYTATITHNLGRYPSITTKDSEDEVIVGEAEYIDENNIQLTFSEAVSGTVYLI